VRGCRVISTLLFPARDHGVCSLVNKETLSELRSELRSDALPVTNIDSSGIQTHDSLCVNRVFQRHDRTLIEKIIYTAGETSCVFFLHLHCDGEAADWVTCFFTSYSSASDIMPLTQLGAPRAGQCQRSISFKVLFVVCKVGLMQGAHIYYGSPPLLQFEPDFLRFQAQHVSTELPCYLWTSYSYEHD